MIPIKAFPLSIKLKKDGYELLVKVNEGPNHILDRLVRVIMTGAQLNTIDNWDPKQEGDSLYLDKYP
jgi:hypothetical protein